MNNNTSTLQESVTSSSLLTSTISRKSGFITTLGCAVVLSLISTAKADSEENTLDDTTVIANRVATPLSKVGNSVSILNISELEQEGVNYLDDALKFVPGVISESTGGQRGSISSLFLRGTNTDQTHIRVDGVRVSGSNIASGGFLGGSGISGLSRIEVLRGPQSALYGGDAIGGVLGLYSKKGSGDPSGSFSIGTGSFNTFSSALQFQGQIDRLSYSFGIGYEETDNDLPNNSFEQINYTLRLDYDVNEALDVGLTLRGFDSQLRTPDNTDPAFSRDADADTESNLATIFAKLQVNEKWTSKLTLGLYSEDFESINFNSPNFFISDGETYSAYWDNTVVWNDRHTTTAGLVYETTDFDFASEFFGLTEDDNDQDQYGVYINHSWDVTEELNLTGGVRWEDFDTFGDEFTWRGSAAYYIEETGTKFHASIGRGFRPPSFIELFGFGGGSNFDLDAETSIGWDFGIDQEFCDGQYSIGVTYFENRIEDSIETTFDQATSAVTNFNASGTSTTRGIEFEAQGKWFNDRLRASVNYTWLDESLSGQPENSAALRVNASITEKLDAGFSVNFLDDRTFGGNDLDSYTLVHLNANYKLSPSLTLNARVENLFDETFEFASFGSGAFESTFPGRGTGVFAGITYEW